MKKKWFAIGIRRLGWLFLIAPFTAFAKVIGLIVNRFIESEHQFRLISLFIGNVPFPIGNRIRLAFYQVTLKSVGTKVTIMPGVVFEGRDCCIGDDVYIGFRSVVFNHVCIGNGVRIAHNVAILSGGRQHVVEAVGDSRRLVDSDAYQLTSIGNQSWIGCHAIVMHSIGHGAIVGAGSVVTKVVQDGAIVVGNPARQISRS